MSAPGFEVYWCDATCPDDRDLRCADCEFCGESKDHARAAWEAAFAAGEESMWARAIEAIKNAFEDDLDVAAIDVVRALSTGGKPE